MGRRSRSTANRRWIPASAHSSTFFPSCRSISSSDAAGAALFGGDSRLPGEQAGQEGGAVLLASIGGPDAVLAAGRSGSRADLAHEILGRANAVAVVVPLEPQEARRRRG